MRQNAGASNVQANDPSTSPDEKSSQAVRSCAERSCATGLGCITIALIVAAVLLRMFLGGGTEEIVGVPSQVPTNFPVLDRDSMRASELTTSKHKSRLVDVSLWWPRLVLSLNANRYSEATVRTIALQNTLRDSLHASQDTVTLTWKKIPGQTAPWLQSYREALTGAGYTILTTSDTTIAFSSDRVTGLLTVEDSEYTTDIDAATAVLHIAHP